MKMDPQPIKVRRVRYPYLPKKGHLCWQSGRVFRVFEPDAYGACHIQYIQRTKSMNGRSIMEIIERICRRIPLAKSITLQDSAMKYCGSYSFDLSFRERLTTGLSWYENQGFRAEPRHHTRTCHEDFLHDPCISHLENDRGTKQIASHGQHRYSTSARSILVGRQTRDLAPGRALAQTPRPPTSFVGRVFLVRFARHVGLVASFFVLPRIQFLHEYNVRAHACNRKRSNCSNRERGWHGNTVGTRIQTCKFAPSLVTHHHMAQEALTLRRLSKSHVGVG